jgi:hypothetical protein
MKTSELSGMQLDWAVAKAEGYPDEDILVDYLNYSTDWRLGGSLIEREAINTEWTGIPNAQWFASMESENLEAHGSTPLVAAMRCYVASRLGDEIDLPVEMHEEDCPAIDGFGCRCEEEVR